MKVTVSLKVTLDVDDPDGYPEEYNAIKDGPRSKRDRQVLTSHARAVREARKEAIEFIEEECGYDVEVDHA